MARPSVIGISGKARHGKDTLADFIVARFGGYKYALASPLKSMLKAGLGIDLYDSYWSSRKEQVIPAIGKSPRQILQTLGTDWGRNLVNEDLWITLAKQRLLQDGPGMVIPDIRFDNEADWIRSVGGLVIHVTRASAPQVFPHPSEDGVAVEPADLTVANDGNLEDLHKTVGTWTILR